MSVILHVSDTHFGRELPEVVDAVCRLATEQCPDIIVLSGDITQRARPEQFTAAGAFMTRLGGSSRLVIPGNHDIPLLDIFTRIVAPYSRYRRIFGRALEPTLDLPEALIVGVRTTRRYRHVNGEISDAQVEAVAAKLRAAQPDQLRVVVTHQPVHVPKASEEHNLLRNGDAAIRAWSDAGVDLILGGHIHLPYCVPLHERIAGLRGGGWIVQAGTAVSSRVRHEAPNSLNVIRHRPRDACVVERWDYAFESERFTLHETIAVGIR